MVINDSHYQDHGTSVAAIIVGLLNGKDINGIAPHAKLVPLQNSNDDFRVDDLDKEVENDTGSIIVGAVNRQNGAEDFTNYDPRVSIAGYGPDLLTLRGPKRKLTMFGGTSAATPQVAAGITLMLELILDLKPRDIKDILIRTKITTPRNQRVEGLVNIVEALKEAGKAQTSPDLKLLKYRTKLSQIFSGK